MSDLSDPAAVFIALGGFTAAAISIRAIASAVVHYQENKLKHTTFASTAIEARLDRMEQAVDSIAVEIERISEGQRFTTKLLNDRTTTPRNSDAGFPRRAES